MTCNQVNTILDYSYTYKYENGKNIQYSVHTVLGTHRYTGKHWVASVKKVGLMCFSEAKRIMSPALKNVCVCVCVCVCLCV